MKETTIRWEVFLVGCCTPHHHQWPCIEGVKGLTNGRTWDEMSAFLHNNSGRQRAKLPPAEWGFDGRWDIPGIDQSEPLMISEWGGLRAMFPSFVSFDKHVLDKNANLTNRLVVLFSICKCNVGVGTWKHGMLWHGLWTQAKPQKSP